VWNTRCTSSSCSSLSMSVNHFGCVVLRQLDGLRAHILMLGRQRRDVARLKCLLQLAEIGEGATDDELRLAFVVAALAISSKPMVDQVELEIIPGRCLPVPRRKTTHLFEEKAHR